MTISPSDERFRLSPTMRQWLDGPMRQMDFVSWDTKDLIVLWWDIAVFLHGQYGPKLVYLEETLKDRGVEIPDNLDSLMRLVRNFL